MSITLEDNDSITVTPPESITTVPEGWVNDAPGHYTHVRPPCVYRMVSTRTAGTTFAASVACALDHLPCSVAKCRNCAYIGTPLGPLQEIPVENHEGVRMRTMFYQPVLPPPPQATRPSPPIGVHVHTPPPMPVVTEPTVPVVPLVAAPDDARPDLQAIENTLPAADPIKDAERSFRRPIFHADGSIEYPKQVGDWEPPRNINGYTRDPDNQWKFLPQWVPCGLRHQVAFLKANCGCIDIIMRCNNPQAPEFGQRLGYETCSKCPVRKP